MARRYQPAGARLADVLKLAGAKAGAAGRSCTDDDMAVVKIHPDRLAEPDEIATELGMDLERVIDLMSWGRDHVSLDTPIDEDGDTSLGDLIAQESSPGPDLTARRPYPDASDRTPPRSVDRSARGPSGG